MKRLWERERKVAEWNVTESNAKIARLYNEITNLHEEVHDLNGQNVQLLRDVTRYHRHWIQAEYRVTQLGEVES
jgi:hypothetical protein